MVSRLHHRLKPSRIHRRERIVMLGLGSNMGNRERYIRSAILLLDDLVGKISALSNVIETAAWGYDSPNTYLNAAISLRTSHSPRFILRVCKAIEREFGRTVDPNGPRYQDRPIDIDILFWGDAAISMPELTIPHPHIADRMFVLSPLNDIAPDFIHPTLGKSIHELFNELANKLN